MERNCVYLFLVPILGRCLVSRTHLFVLEHTMLRGSTMHEQTPSVTKKAETALAQGWERVHTQDRAGRWGAACQRPILDRTWQGLIFTLSTHFTLPNSFLVSRSLKHEQILTRMAKKVPLAQFHFGTSLRCLENWGKLVDRWRCAAFSRNPFLL